MFGLLVVALGGARLYWAKRVRDMTPPWQRRRHHERDFEGRGEPFDAARHGAVSGVVITVLGVVIIVLFSVIPAIR